MESDFEALPRPTLARTLSFWLAAVLLGAVLLATLFYYARLAKPMLTSLGCRW